MSETCIACVVDLLNDKPSQPSGVVIRAQMRVESIATLTRTIGSNATSIAQQRSRPERRAGSSWRTVVPGAPGVPWGVATFQPFAHG